MLCCHSDRTSQTGEWRNLPKLEDPSTPIQSGLGMTQDTSQLAKRSFIYYENSHILSANHQ